MNLTKTTILIKTDKAVKESAQKTAEKIGIPLSTILNAYLRQFVSEGRVEFSAYAPNTKTRTAIHNAQRRKNIEIYPTTDALFEGVFGKKWRKTL